MEGAAGETCAKEELSQALDSQLASRFVAEIALVYTSYVLLMARDGRSEDRSKSKSPPGTRL
jgi:hypothetical protein